MTFIDVLEKHDIVLDRKYDLSSTSSIILKEDNNIIIAEKYNQEDQIDLLEIRGTLELDWFCTKLKQIINN